MENLEKATVTTERGCKPRKIPINKSSWKREQEKGNRYRMKNLPKMPKCKHAGSNFKCSLLKVKETLEFLKALYSSHNKTEQDKFILTCCNIKPPARTDRKKDNSILSRKISIEHFIRKRNGVPMRVCQKAFCNILNISKYRVSGVCKRFYEQRSLPAETRGGDRSSGKYNLKRAAVKLFIGKFQVVNIHYCRSKNAGRQYLAGDLSINKMYRMYIANHSLELHVKPSYFRKIFNTCFNLGFKSPSSDKCSTCLMYSEQLKAATDPKLKSDLMIQMRVHKLRAQTFYQLAKEEREGMLTISFDCQKNMVLPKVPDQAAYFSRQSYLFNFGVVQGSSSASLNKNNVFLYAWLENEHGKGSNEIASALYHRLCSNSFEGISVVRLICDGCGAQNKNSAVMGMLSFWLRRVAPVHVSEVQIIFPIPGHSYIPPDRVFAQLEKKVKSKERIITPNEYLDIFEENGQVIRLGSNLCKVQDWKNAAASCIKPPGQWHFQFNKAKRFIITKTMNNLICIRGEISYRSDLRVAKSVVKKGKTILQIRPEQLEVGVSVKQAKKDDVGNLLLKHFGENWADMNELQYYRSVLHSEVDDTAEDGTNESEPRCADVECCHQNILIV